MKKKILAGLLSAMMVVSLAACGSSETGATTTDSKNETTANTADGTAAAATDAQGGYEGKEVKVWISSGAEDDIYREMFDKIEGDLNITITDEYYSKDELDNKMQTSSIAGDMPDAVVADYLLIPKYYEAGLVANLDDYVTDELMDEERAQKYVDSLPVLKEGQTFCFDCNPDVACFGRCCRALTLPLTPYDVLRLVRRLKMPSQKFLNMYTTIRTLPDSGFPIPMLNMRPGPNEECPFVTPGGCDIYDDRPGACRSYPLGRGTSPSPNGVVETHYLVQEDHCRGFDGGRDWTAQEWFEHEGLLPYNASNDRYMRLAAMVTASGRPLEEKLANLCVVCCYQLDNFRQLIGKMKIFDRVNLPEERRKAVMESDEAALDFAFDWIELVLFGVSENLSPKKEQ